MTTVNLGIIGGGQLGSLLAVAAKKLKIKTTIFCDDINAPAKNYCDEFIFGDYKDDKIIETFINKVDVVTYEFENCLLYTSPSPRDRTRSRMPSSA